MIAMTVTLTSKVWSVLFMLQRALSAGHHLSCGAVLRSASCRSGVSRVLELLLVSLFSMVASPMVGVAVFL